MDVKILQDTAMADVVAVLATTTAVCGLSFCSAAAAAGTAAGSAAASAANPKPKIPHGSCQPGRTHGKAS